MYYLIRYEFIALRSTRTPLTSTSIVISRVVVQVVSSPRRTTSNGALAPSQLHLVPRENSTATWSLVHASFLGHHLTGLRSPHQLITSVSLHISRQFRVFISEHHSTRFSNPEASRTCRTSYTGTASAVRVLLTQTMATAPDFVSLDGRLSSSNQSVYSFTSDEVFALQNQSHEDSIGGEARLPDLDRPTSTELAELPIRGQKDFYHATWARTFRSRPELYFVPETVQEVQKIVILASRCRRRVVVVGAGHSPSDLTCSSAWMVNLKNFSRVLDVKHEEQSEAEKHSGKSHGVALLQAGITLHDINREMLKHGLTMPNLGSIDIQSIAGAISTATHGSSTQHGLLSGTVRSLRIVLADGRAVWCSPRHRSDLFRAALVSLGCLGIVTEIEFGLVRSRRIEWHQSVLSLDNMLSRWETDLWVRSEFVRCWWLPYGRKVICWQADKTTKPLRQPKASFYGGTFGYYLYHTLLWMSHHVPRILPWVETLIFSSQYRYSPGPVTDAVEVQHEGLLMDCLFSQFVNEWAIPLRHGPEAIQRLSAWMHGDEKAARIPFSSKGIYVHAPIEVRVTDGSSASPRGYLDPTMEDGATLYLNATLYRPFGLDPPCVSRYYEAFEWLMKELGGRPHWAKNWSYTTRSELQLMYGENMNKFLKVRGEVDPEGVFLGAWHRRNLLGGEASLRCEEVEVERRKATNVKTPMKGGMDWFGAQAPHFGPGVKRTESDESFEFASSEDDDCLEELLEKL